MNIIIPVIDYINAKDCIAQGFHTTDFVCIYNSSDESYKWLEKKSISKKEGNLCVELRRRGILTIITSNIELMSLALYTELGLKVYKAKGESVEENIKLFFSNQLEPFTYKNAIGVIDCSCGGAHKISYN